MPQDCEISWREHRLSIKDRNIFGMILDSSTKHHTANMRLLLITLLCVAATTALPHSKQKRDILPGDPRYGTKHDHHHHHHHENAIEGTKSSEGYIYAKPPVVHDVYGPPGVEPSVALGSDYLPPVTDSIKTSTPLPAVVDVRLAPDSHVEQSNIEIKKTITPTTAPVVVEKTQEISGTVPAASYGFPIENNIKTIVEPAPHAHVETKIAAAVPAVKLVEPAPLVRGLADFAGTLNTAPALTAFGSRHLVGSSLLNEGLYGESYTDFDTYAPTSPSFYQGALPSYGAISPGFGRFGLSQSVYAPPPLPPSIHAYSFPQTYALPRTTLQVPHSLTHAVDHVAPVQPLQPLPSLPLRSLPLLPTAHSVKTLTPVQPALIEDLPPAQPIHHVENLAHPVETLPSVRTIASVQTVHNVKSLSPVEPLHPVPTLPPVRSVHAVKNLVSEAPLHPIPTLPPVQSLHSARTFAPVQPIQPLAPIQRLQHIENFTPAPLHSAGHAIPVHRVHSVKNFAPIQTDHTLKSVTPLEPLHAVSTLPPVEPLHSIKSYAPVQTLPTLKSVTPLEPVHAAPTLPPIQPLHSVKSFAPVQTLQTLKSVTPLEPLHAAPTLPPVQPLHSVKSFAPIQTLHTVKSVTPLPPIHAVERTKTSDFPLIPSVHGLETVTSHPIETKHAITELIKTKTLPIGNEHLKIHAERGPIGDLLQSFGSLLPQLPPLPQVPSFGGLSTPAPTVELSTPSPHLLTGGIRKDVTIAPPILPPQHLVNGVSIANGYVQPTDENGGYIY